MSRVPACWFALLLAVHGQADSDLAPRPVDGHGAAPLPFRGRVAPAPREGKDSSKVLAGELHEIRLVGNGETPPGSYTFAPLDTVEVSGLRVPDQDGLAILCAAALGGPLTENSLDALTDDILGHYQARGRPVVDIMVPEQDLSKGSLTISIAEGRVGKVVLQHSEHFDTGLLARGVRVNPGDEVATPALQEQLDWLSRNPFRSAGLYASPGVGPGDADFLFTLEERRPWRGYLGYENTGTKAAGENRFYFGGNWGNVLGLDHQLGYQFTMGESVDQFQAHSLAYEIPLHQQHHFLRFNATWQTVEADVVVSGLPLVADGETWELYAAVGRLLPRANGFSRELALGVELKTTDNFLSFGGSSLSGDKVDLLQARADYRASGEWEGNRLSVRGALVGSPGDLTGRNDDVAFEAFRPGASSSYLYATAGADWQRRLPGEWSLRMAAEGQLASGALLAIEQLGLGGYETVRGYDERIYLADSGYAFSTELRTPPIRLGDDLPGDPLIQFLGYLDHATGWRKFGNDESFTGVGLGSRARIGDGELRFDVGWPLRKGNGAGVHAGFHMSF